MLAGPGLEACQIHVAALVAGDRHDLQTRHHGGGRIGAVSRHRDQADIALAFAAGRVVAADGQKARIFALAAGVGLQRNRIEAGDLHQHGLELLEQLLIALRLLQRRKRMHVREAAPGYRDHLGRRVQLHRA